MGYYVNLDGEEREVSQEEAAQLAQAGVEIFTDSEPEAPQKEQAKARPEGDWLQMLAPYSTGKAAGESAPLAVAKDVASLPGRAMAKGIYALTGAGDAPMSARELPSSGNPWRDIPSGILRDPWTVVGGSVGGAVAPRLAAAARLPVAARFGIGAGAGGVMANIPGATEFALEGKPYDVGATTAFGALTGGLGEGLASGLKYAKGLGEESFRGLKRWLLQMQDRGVSKAEALAQVAPYLDKAWSAKGLQTLADKMRDIYESTANPIRQEIAPTATAYQEAARTTGALDLPSHQVGLPPRQNFEYLDLMGNKWEPGSDIAPLRFKDLTEAAKAKLSQVSGTTKIPGGAPKIREMLGKMEENYTGLGGEGGNALVSYADLPNILAMKNDLQYYPGTSLSEQGAAPIKRFVGRLFNPEASYYQYESPQLSEAQKNALSKARKLYSDTKSIDRILELDPARSVGPERTMVGDVAQKLGAPVAIPLAVRNLAQKAMAGQNAARLVPALYKPVNDRLSAWN